LNLAMFYQKFDGYIDLAVVNAAPNRDGKVNSSGTTVSYNGDASTRGIEMQFDARPTTNWDVGLNASYADAHFDNASVPCNDFNGDGKPDSIGIPKVPVGQQVSFCTRDDSLAAISKFAMNASTEVRAEFAGVALFLRGLFSYRPAFTSKVLDYRFPSIANLNLYVGVRGPGNGWELSGFVKNAFNTRQVLSIGASEFKYGTSGGTLPPPLNSGYRQVSLAQPREFGITANLNF